MRNVIVVVVMVILFNFITPYICQMPYLGTLFGAAFGVLLIDRR
jgi:hypothetical protein